MSQHPIPTILQVADTVLSSLAATSGQAGASGVDERLTSLYFLFDKNWTRGLELVDQRAVRCLVAQNSKRKVFQVRGKTATDLYLVFPRHYCSCQAFLYLANRGDAIALQCKHQLAAQAAEALNHVSLATKKSQVASVPPLQGQVPAAEAVQAVSQLGQEMEEEEYETVPVELREANPEDAKRLLRIERASFPRGDYTPDGFMEMSIQNQHKEEWKETTVLVAVIEGCIQAYTVAWLVGDELQVIDLAVDRAWRRQGLGSLLMARLIKMCLREPPLKVILEVRASNHAALELYTGMGFEITGTRKNYYHHPQEDGILLMQVLQESAQPFPCPGPANLALLQILSEQERLWKNSQTGRSLQVLTGLDGHPWEHSLLDQCRGP
ncbi:hypothetical protein WJX84_000648 [Apatococcus fuscideae]|uniref:Ribosomal-protein-alanine N-acetyltransferase n=1 Tax=Apatococcus fuscideae TaxID=2026836 RepID=A0AAW1SX00_9CHLO